MGAGSLACVMAYPSFPAVMVPLFPCDNDAPGFRSSHLSPPDHCSADHPSRMNTGARREVAASLEPVSRIFDAGASSLLPGGVTKANICRRLYHQPYR